MKPVSVVLADPHRYVGGFQGQVDGAGQGVADRVQVDSVFQPGREGCDGLVGVVPGPVEPAVHPSLYPQAQRVEECRRGQRAGGHGHRGVERQHPGGQQDQACIQADQQASYDRVRQCAGEHEPDVQQLVPPPARNSQPTELRGRCQASSAPQADSVRPMAPSVTVKLPTAEANEMPPASAQATAVASSASASPNTAIAVAGEATRRQGRDPSAVMTCPPRSRPKRRGQDGCPPPPTPTCPLAASLPCGTRYARTVPGTLPLGTEPSARTPKCGSVVLGAPRRRAGSLKSSFRLSMLAARVR